MPSPDALPETVLTAEWVLPVEGAPIAGGFVRMQGNRITAIGAVSALDKAQPIAPGTLLTPGLVNTHLHLEQSFPDRVAKPPQTPFSDWLLQVVAKLAARATPAERRARCVVGADELLKTGATCVNDIASGPDSVQVLQEKGLRGKVSLEMFHPGFDPVEIAPWIAAFERFQAAFQENSRLSAGISPHSPYNVSIKAWQALRRELQPGWVHSHGAEFADETAYLRGKPSCIPVLHQTILGRTFSPEHPAPSPIEALSKAGLLDARTLIAHGLHTSASDRALLADAGVSLAHCPRSNRALHGHTLHWPDWAESGVAIGLGTDGRLSTPTLDLRDEAREAMAVHGWNAADTLAAMTLHGARAMRLSAAIGSLAVNKQADMVLWQVAEAHRGLMPEAALLQRETHVLQSWVAGCSVWRAEQPHA